MPNPHMIEFGMEVMNYMQNIIDKHRMDSPTFSNMEVKESVYNFTLFFDVSTTQSSKKIQTTLQ
jgi:hypothetical protein